MDFILNKKNIFSLLIILFPIALVTGPLIPELISFLLLIYFFFNFSSKKSLKIFKSKIIIFLLLLYFYLLIISLSKIEISEVLKDQFFYFRYIIFSVAIYFLVNERVKILNYLGITFLILFLILIFDVFIQYLFGQNILGMVSSTENRYSGLFGDELVLGSYLSRFFPFLLGLIYINHSLKYKSQILFLLLIIVPIGVFITGERTAFGLTLITIFLLFIKKDFRKFAFLGILSILIVLIILSYFNKSQRYRIFIEPFHQMSLLSTEFLNKYLDVAIEYSPDTLKTFNIFSSHHHSHYITGINIFKDNILFGVGPDQFRKKCNNKKYAFGTDPCSTHPHNIAVQILSETGIIGFFFYMFILFFLLYKIFKAMNQARYESVKDLEYFIFVTLLINLWPLFPSGNLFNNWLSYILYFPVGFYLYLANHKNNHV